MRQQQMILPIGQDQKWFNSPVRFHKGSLTDIPQHIPDFDRQDFVLASKPDYPTQVNPRLHLIVRKPFRTDGTFVPIGIVSKDYVLVKHAEVVETAKEVMRQFGIEPERVAADLTLTEYGERMALSLYLPPKYAFDPGDGHELAMRLEIINSVDGSTRFRAMMGWFRFVCSNGLVIGVTEAQICRRHMGDLNLSDVGSVLSSGLERAKAEKENFSNWREHSVSPEAIVKWVEEDVRGQWGLKAATRAFHISRTGHDVEIVGQYKGQTPTTIETKQVRQVPGSPSKSKNLFDVSQILAWLAKGRRDIQEQLEWREQIPDILKPLMNRHTASESK